MVDVNVMPTAVEEPMEAGVAQIPSDDLTHVVDAVCRGAGAGDGGRIVERRVSAAGIEKAVSAALGSAAD
jgi:hypothetical protein